MENNGPLMKRMVNVMTDNELEIMYYRIKSEMKRRKE
jgi:hypothetical protein